MNSSNCLCLRVVLLIPCRTVPGCEAACMRVGQTCICRFCTIKCVWLRDGKQSRTSVTLFSVPKSTSSCTKRNCHPPKQAPHHSLVCRHGKVESVRLRSVPVKLDAKMPRRAAVLSGNISDSRGTAHAYVVFQEQAAAQAALASNMQEVGLLDFLVLVYS